MDESPYYWEGYFYNIVELPVQEIQPWTEYYCDLSQMIGGDDHKPPMSERVDEFIPGQGYIRKEE